MRIIGNLPPNTAISSGLDSVTEGIVQSTKTKGIASLDSEFNNFSIPDLGVPALLDQQTPISGDAQFPDPETFFSNQKEMSDLVNQIRDPKFQPPKELRNFLREFPKIPDETGHRKRPMEILNEMRSTVVGLNDLQSNLDNRLQVAFLGGPRARFQPELKDSQKNSIENEKAEAQQEPILLAELQLEEVPSDSQENKSIEFSTSTDANLGPILRGEADADIGKNTYLDFGGEAFVGAKASVNETAEVGDYGSVTGGVGAYAGVGAKGDIDVGVKDGKFSLKFGGGLALGIGAELNLGFDLDFGKIAEDLYDAGSDLADGMNDIFDWGVGAAEDAGETVEDTTEDVIEIVEDTAGDIIDGAGDLAEDAGDFIEDTFDFDW